MAKDDDSIIDYATGMATVENGAVHIDGRNLPKILEPFIGKRVKLILSHKPEKGDKLPPFLWMVNETGELKRVGDEWQVGDKPFNLKLLPGYRSVVSVVNMEFKVMDPVDMLGSHDFRAEEKKSIIETEKRLRQSLEKLSNVLGDMVGDRK